MKNIELTENELLALIRYFENFLTDNMSKESSYGFEKFRTLVHIYDKFKEARNSSDVIENDIDSKNLIKTLDK